MVQLRQLIIRAFVPADQPAARALILGGLGERFGWVDETRNPDLDDIAASYASPQCTFLVAQSGHELIGAGALRRTGKHSGEIVRVSVRSDWRGQGVGRALVTRLVACARQLGLRRVEVETNHDWYNAITLYQRCGFIPFAEDDESIYLALDLGEGHK
jgi:GNAT superfamily N-acetyltransferase